MKGSLRLLALGLGGLAAWRLLRRQGLRGGATDAEAAGPLPGDEVLPAPMIQTTHGITVDAPPSAIWPWLLQAGFRGAGRAGWYTDSWLDPVVEGGVLRLLVPADALPERPGRRSATELMPEHQHLAVGDVVPDGPPGTAWFVVRRLDPERALVLHSDSHLKYLVPPPLQGTRFASEGEFTWTFALGPLSDGRTRLLLRTRAVVRPAWLLRAMRPVLYLAEAIFPGQILRGIRRRAEGMGAAVRAEA